MTYICRMWGIRQWEWLNYIHHISEVMVIPGSSHWPEKGKQPPYFKKVKKENPGNYRPTSVLFLSSRIMEQILLEAMLQYMENKQLICDSQNSFNYGQIVPDKFSGLLWWAYNSRRSGKSEWCHLLGLVQSIWHRPTWHTCLWTGRLVDKGTGWMAALCCN